MKVFVCAVDLCGLESNLMGWTPLLSDTRKEKLARITHPAVIAQSIGAELALIGARSMVSPQFAPPDAYVYAASGAPIRSDGLQMSLSHTPGMAVCALADAPVGIDIEAPRPIPESLARRVLAPEEWRNYQTAANKSACFLAYWTQKEAAFKCAGIEPQLRTLRLPAGRILSVATKDASQIVFQLRAYQSFRPVFPRFLHGAPSEDMI